MSRTTITLADLAQLLQISLCTARRRVAALRRKRKLRPVSGGGGRGNHQRYDLDQARAAFDVQEPPSYASWTLQWQRYNYWKTGRLPAVPDRKSAPSAIIGDRGTGTGMGAIEATLRLRQTLIERGIFHPDRPVLKPMSAPSCPSCGRPLEPENRARYASGARLGTKTGNPTKNLRKSLHNKH